MNRTKLFHILFPIIIFSLLVFLISYKFVIEGGVITYQDNTYIWPEGNFDYFSTWTTSFLGQPNSTNSGLLIGLLPRLLSGLGLSHNVTSYVLTFLPILLTSLSAYFIMKNISGNNLYAYFAGLFIILNNFMLEQIIIFPGLYFWNVIGLMLLTYFSYRIYRNKKTRFLYFLLITISSLFMVHPFLWIIFQLYLFVFILFLLVIDKDKKNFRFFLFQILILFLHSYWIFPFLYNLLNSGITSVYHNSVDAIYEGLKSQVSVLELFNFINYFSFPLISFPHNILQVFLNVIIVLFVVIGVNIKKNNRYLLFLFVIYLIFLTLALGPRLPIFGSVFDLVFYNIPGFGLFRSFTRFLVLSLVSLLFIGAIIVRDTKFKYINVFIISIILLTLLSNGIYFTGNMGGLIGSAKVPSEYFDLNKKLLEEKDSTSYNILIYPYTGYETNIWSVNQNYKNFAQINNFKSYFFSQPSVYNLYSLGLENQDDSSLYSQMFDYDFNLTKIEDYDKYINLMNIKYLLVQKDLFDISKLATVDYTKYLRFFTDSNYNLIENNNYFAVFENNNYFPRIYGENVFFQRVSDTKYKIYIANLDSTNLTLLQNFNRNWELYLIQNPSRKWCQKHQEYKRVATFECANSEEVNWNINDITSLKERTLFASNHQNDSFFGNKWTLKTEEIKDNIDNSYYTLNQDGSINVELVLQYKTQSVFYLGILISLAATSITIFYLFKNRKSFLS